MSKDSVSAIRERMEAGSCTGKREYMSMREAHDGAIFMANRAEGSLGAYQCPFCCFFHVGHRKGRKRMETERALNRVGSQKFTNKGTWGENRNDVND